MSEPNNNDGNLNLEKHEEEQPTFSLTETISQQEDIPKFHAGSKSDVEDCNSKHSTFGKGQSVCSTDLRSESGNSSTRSKHIRSRMRYKFFRKCQANKDSTYHKLINLEDEISLEKCESVILPNLAEKERDYVNLVKSGNVDVVKTFIKSNPGFNFNCTNFEGQSALHIAIMNNDEEMVKSLLELCKTEVGDSILHAIRSGHLVIVNLLLNHLATFSPDLEYCGVSNSPEFPPNITPLIFAAHCGQYEVIGMLLERGHRIDPPHHPQCFCKEICLSKEEFNLNQRYSRLNVYKALANPAYICHTSSDPILTAFKLYIELTERGSMEEEFYSAYMELANDLKKFPVDIIRCCRTDLEIEVLLSPYAGCCSPGKFLFPRLELAVDCEQKEFVAHPNVQHALRRAWLGNCYLWNEKSNLSKVFTVVLRIPLLPLMPFICWIIPNSKIVNNWRLPINKLISYLASYLVFLVLIFIESMQDKTTQSQGPPNTGLEPILIIYVVAYIFNLLRLCVLQGPRRFFRHLWNWYELLNQILFVLTFTFWLAALINTYEDGSLKLERKYWSSFDPTLLAEGFFAVATILSFSKVLLLCQLNYYLGPLQVSLGKMTEEISKFIALFIIIILAFSAGLCHLYQYYDGMVQQDSMTGSKIMQESSFVSFPATLKTLFWAIFCMTPLESADVIIEDSPPHEGSSGMIQTKHIFTEAVGYVALATFEVLTVIVIVNMLIAAITNTYKDVADNAHIEWTYARTRVYLSYISQTVLPPPLNLLPTYTGLSSIIKWCTCCKRGGGKEREEPKPLQREYPEVISQTVQRYFRDKEVTAGQGKSFSKYSKS